jgi:hypothetical protein
MKKKLLVILIAASSMLTPNLASAIVIDVGGAWAGNINKVPYFGWDW